MMSWWSWGSIASGNDGHLCRGTENNYFFVNSKSEVNLNSSKEKGQTKILLDATSIIPTVIHITLYGRIYCVYMYNLLITLYMKFLNVVFNSKYCIGTKHCVNILCNYSSDKHLTRSLNRKIRVIADKAC